MTILVIIVQFISIQALTREAEYNAVKDTNLTTMPIGEEFDQVSLMACASSCISSNKTCYSYIYNETTRHCRLGSWVVSLNAFQQKVQGQLFSSGKFCNTTRNFTVQSDGSISYTDFLFCTDLEVGSCTPRPVVTLHSGRQVMCDTVTDGGGWTIFQRRVSGTVDFYRNWTEYKSGFGDFNSGNFYLGNENIYLLTTKNRTELRVDMIFNGTNYFAKYSSFNISSETDGYRLYVGGYTGNAGDKLAEHNGMKFSTFDRDNDKYSGNCASYHKAAWWHNACYSSSLNGIWGYLGSRGINWLPNYNATFSEMKFRYTL
ncbi:fibrinogen-like protein A [Physella acuta]|uniref:fibrinogen-like protein A n=1 Tax=Physella acuta TaxID=109671 RepID=UPI0027DB4942|nr:fibrinogen-like protein A [Physella acuta]